MSAGADVIILEIESLALIGWKVCMIFNWLTFAIGDITVYDRL